MCLFNRSSQQPYYRNGISKTRIMYSELIIIASASIAAFLGILLPYRQILHNRSHSKAYICLAIGLVLWFCAEIIWASYELVFHVAAPIHSLSDILWLAGYPFFAYNLIATYRQFHNRFNKGVYCLPASSETSSL
jgi:hypothetical protein